MFSTQSSADRQAPGIAIAPPAPPTHLGHENWEFSLASGWKRLKLDPLAAHIEADGGDVDRGIYEAGYGKAETHCDEFQVYEAEIKNEITTRWRFLIVAVIGSGNCHAVFAPDLACLVEACARIRAVGCFTTRGWPFNGSSSRKRE